MQLEAVKWFLLLLLLLNLCNCLAYRYIDIYRLQQKSIPLIISGNIRHITNKPPLSSIIKSRRLTFFGHLARMDENADASQELEATTGAATHSLDEEHS